MGQLSDPQVRFLGRGSHATLAFRPDDLLLTLPVTVPDTSDPPHRRDFAPADQVVGVSSLHVHLDGANPSPMVAGTTRLPGVAHFFLGNTPSQQFTNIPTYQGIRYQDIYPGIDLIYDGSAGQLKSTYLVAPGVDPTQIRWRYLGGTRPQLDPAGNLQFTVGVTLPVGLATPPTLASTGLALPTGAAPMRATTTVTVTEAAPIAWQEIAGQRVSVDVQFVVEPNHRVGFHLGTYDPQYPLVIDPTLVFSSFLGGAGADRGNDIALDAAGNSYVTGRTISDTLPGGSGTRATYDAFVVKLNPAGSQAIYTTFIGGNDDDGSNGIAVDASGQAYIAGYTRSTNLPVLNAYQTTLRGWQDAFIGKLTAAGTLAYLTYLGGTAAYSGVAGPYNDAVTGIAINSAGEAYVTGPTNSRDFPVVNAFLGTYGGGLIDLFVAKLSSTGNTLVYSSFAGGTFDNYPGGIAVDSAGNAYVTGRVDGNRSGYLTTTLTGFYSGAVLLKITSSGARTFGTIFGDATGLAVAVDSTSAAYITGWAGCTSCGISASIPLPANAYQPLRRGNYEAFLVKLAGDGQSIQAGTYLGGTGAEYGNDIALDSENTAYITGYTSSTDFPVVAPTYGYNRGNYDAYVAAITGGGTGLRFSTYLGSSGFDTGRGIAVTGTGDVYVAGETWGWDFPVNGPIQGQNGYQGAYDAFVAIFTKATVLANDQQNAPEKWCSCPSPQRVFPKPVNTRTGGFWFTTQDLAVQTPGPSLAWSRTYASQTIGTWTTGFPSGWRHTYATRLLLPGISGETNHAIIVSPDGNKLRFEDLGSYRYTPVAGVYASLVHGTGIFTYTLRDQTRYVFDDNQGYLQAVVDPQGRQVTVGYDANSRISTITDASDTSRKLTLTYGTTGYLSTVSDGVRQVQYGYDVNNHLSSATDVMSRATTYTYYPASSLVYEVWNPLSQLVERVVYDTATPPRVTQQTLQDSSQRAFQYLAASTVITTTGVDGRRDVEEVLYGANNAMTGVRRNGQAILGSDFDATISPGSLRDGNNNAIATVFNDNGQPLVATDALQQQARQSYDSHSNLIATTDPLGVMSRFRYDSSNNVISTTVGITSTSLVRATTLYTYTYNVRYPGDSLLQEIRNPDGVVTRYEYPTTGTLTQRGQQIRTIVGYGTPLAQTTGYAYDNLGRVVTTTLGLGTALQRLDVTRYNADNKVQQTIQNYQDGVYSASAPDQDLITAYGYDHTGRQVWVRDVLGRSQVTHYDAKGQVDWTARNVTPLQFDSQGQVVAQTFSPATPDRNVATLYGYDGLGRTVLVTETGILTGTFTLATRQFSQATQRVTRTQYDSLSRPITVTLNFQSGQPSTADMNVNLYTRYDGAGNVITQTDTLGRRIYTQYDKLSRPVTVTLNFEDGNPLTGPRDADLVSVTRYDALGRVSRRIDNYVDGIFVATETITDRITLYDYDPLGRVITTTVNYAPGQTDPSLNRVKVSRYDLTTTRLQGQRDLLGRWASLGYDALGQVTYTTANCRDSGGNPVATGCAAYSAATRDRNITIFTVYDALGRTSDTYQNYIDGTYSTTATDEDIRTQTVYDGVGRVTKTVGSYQDGVYSSATPDRDIVTSTTYDGLGRTTQVTDVLGATTKPGYNGLDQTVVMTDTLGRVTRTGYDGTGTQRWQTTPDGRLTLYQIDGLGRVVATTQNYQDGVSTVGESDSDLITRISYDAAGRRLRTTDSVGRVTVFTYDNRDRLITVTEDYLTTTCTGTDCNVQTQYQYDRADNRVRVIDGRSITTQQATYDAANQQRTWVDGLGRTTTFGYDAAGRPTQRLDPRGVANDLTYGYDGQDRLTSTSATNLGTLTASYDALGRRLSLIDGTGTTSFVYDALGRTTSLTAPNTGSVAYQYDGRGQRTRLTYPASSAVIDYTYRLNGQIQTVLQGATTLATYAYDAVGRLVQVGRANDAVTNYRYDGADRLLGLRTISKGAIASGTSYQLDRLGLRGTTTDTLPATVTPSSGRIKTQTFEAEALVDGYSGGDAVVGTVSLEATTPLKERRAARVSNVGTSYVREDFTAADTIYVALYLRVDAAPAATTQILAIRNGSTTVGNLALTTSRTLQLRNGTTVLGTSAALTVGTLYRVGLRQSKGTGVNAVLAGFLVTGDVAFGAAFTTNSTQTFTTQASQVWLGATTATAASITFDDVAVDTTALAAPMTAASTRTTSYGYDRLNRLTGATESPGSVYTYAYDRAGNRTDGGRTYDNANQITNAGFSYDAVGNLLGDGTTTYTYNALSRVTSTTRAGTTTTNSYNGDGTLVSQVTGATTTRYTQDLASPLSQVLQTVGANTTTYLYGLERLAVNSSPKTWYISDGLGSVRRTVNDAGSVLATTSYDPWGSPQSALSTPFGFTGELQDSAGQMYLRARWYNATYGIFTSRDAFAGFPGRPYSLHQYQYAYANPVLWTDASGQFVGIAACSDCDTQDACAKWKYWPFPLRRSPKDIGLVRGMFAGRLVPESYGLPKQDGTIDQYPATVVAYETVVDMYTFSYGEFAIRGSVRGLVSVLQAGYYQGIVTGWSNFLGRSDISNYGGGFTSQAVSISFPLDIASFDYTYSTSDSGKMKTLVTGFSVGVSPWPSPVSYSETKGNATLVPNTKASFLPGERPSLADACRFATFIARGGVKFESGELQVQSQVITEVLANGGAWYLSGGG